MKALEVKNLGGPEQIHLVELAVPEPGPDEILVKVEFSTVMRPDAMMRRGEYVTTPPTPYVPGREVAGVIEAVGSEVSRLRPGMRVTADMLTGANADYGVAAEKTAIIVPEHVRLRQAICYHLMMPVAFLAYHEYGRIRPGQTILLHQASNNLGSMFTQLAVRRGDNTLIALASNAEKAAYCRRVGATHAIDVSSRRYVDEVLDLTDGEGVDVSMNSLAGWTLEPDLRVIKPRGLWLFHEALEGFWSEIRYLDLLLKSLTIRPFSVYTVWDTPRYKDAQDFLYGWLNREDLMEPSAILALDEGRRAHELIEDRRTMGRLVLAH